MKFNFFLTRKWDSCGLLIICLIIFHLGTTPECDCEGAGFGSFGGCYIDPHEAPPRGYKCNCLNGVGFGCTGKVEKCDSPYDVGCSGCSGKECCSAAGTLGDCNGYDW